MWGDIYTHTFWGRDLSLDKYFFKTAGKPMYKSFAYCSSESAVFSARDFIKANSKLTEIQQLYAY
jgi:hypothetical protein